MDKRTWAHKLACINESIYDCENNIKDAKWRLASLEVDLKCAKEGTLYHKPNEVPQIQQQIDKVSAYLEREKRDLAHYKQMKQEHFENEPK